MLRPELPKKGSLRAQFWPRFWRLLTPGGAHRAASSSKSGSLILQNLRRSAAKHLRHPAHRLRRHLRAARRRPAARRAAAAAAVAPAPPRPLPLAPPPRPLLPPRPPLLPRTHWRRTRSATTTTTRPRPPPRRRRRRAPARRAPPAAAPSAAAAGGRYLRQRRTPSRSLRPIRSPAAATRPRKARSRGTAASRRWLPRAAAASAHLFVALSAPWSSRAVSRRRGVRRGRLYSLRRWAYATSSWEMRSREWMDGWNGGGVAWWGYAGRWRPGSTSARR